MPLSITRRRSLYGTLLAFCFSLFSSTTSFADDRSRECRDAIWGREWSIAFEHCTKATEAGSAEGQYLLGWLLWSNKVPNRDPRAAVDLIERSANQGHLDAIFAMGLLYVNSTAGVPRNYRKAFRYLEQASSRGHLGATAFLGMLYSLGDGAPKNPKKAFELFSKAAEGGNALGQYYLGRAYAQGQGVRLDLGKAYFWFLLAEACGSKRVAGQIINLEVSLPRATIESVQESVAAWRVKENGQPTSRMCTPQHFFGEGERS